MLSAQLAFALPYKDKLKTTCNRIRTQQIGREEDWQETSLFEVGTDLKLLRWWPSRTKYRLLEYCRPIRLERMRYNHPSILPSVWDVPISENLGYQRAQLLKTPFQFSENYSNSMHSPGSDPLCSAFTSSGDPPRFRWRWVYDLSAHLWNAENHGFHLWDRRRAFSLYLCVCVSPSLSFCVLFLSVKANCIGAYMRQKDCQANYNSKWLFCPLNYQKEWLIILVLSFSFISSTILFILFTKKYIIYFISLVKIHIYDKFYLPKIIKTVYLWNHTIRFFSLRINNSISINNIFHFQKKKKKHFPFINGRVV